MRMHRLRQRFAPSPLVGEGRGEGDRPPFPVAYEAVEKMNQAKAPRAVVRSAA